LAVAIPLALLTGDLKKVPVTGTEPEKQLLLGTKSLKLEKTNVVV
jgi:hypothetical protein